jgi:hypothetical protein
MDTIMAANENPGDFLRVHSQSVVMPPCHSVFPRLGVVALAA